MEMVFSNRLDKAGVLTGIVMIVKVEEIVVEMWDEKLKLEMPNGKNIAVQFHSLHTKKGCRLPMVTNKAINLKTI